MTSTDSMAMVHSVLNRAGYLVFWIASFLLATSPAAAQSVSTGSEPVMTSRVAAGISGSRAPRTPSVEVPIRAVVRSFETAAIGAEVNARITFLPAREGDQFRKGDLLVQIDCDRLIAERDAALAAMRSHSVTYESQRQLMSYRAAGSLAVEQSRFELEKAEADLRALSARLRTCVIHAPFDGRVVEKIAQQHEIAQLNQPLIRIVNETRLEIVMMVPSIALARFSPGTFVSVKFDETGEVQQARILQSTGFIEPISQSVRLLAEFRTPASTLIPGMSGTVVLDREGAER